MSSTYTVFPPSSSVDKKAGRHLASRGDDHTQSSAPNYLSPNSPGYIPGHSASPTVNDTNTPAESVSVLSVNYQSSDYSDIGDDPFYHINFDAIEGASPSFLVSDEALGFADDHPLSPSPDQSADAAQAGLYQPMSPGHTPSLGTATSPADGHKGLRANHTVELAPSSVSPQELSKPFVEPAVPFHVGIQSTYTLTPSASGSRQSSDGDVAVEPAPVMSEQSPYLTVSVWGSDHQQMPAARGSRTLTSDQLDGASHVAATSSVRDAEGRWVREDAASRTGGLDPESRPRGEMDATVNETAAKREVEKKNREVRHWLTESTIQGESVGEGAEDSRPRPTDDDNISPTDIPLGDKTENRPLPGQTYFLERGGEMTAQDIEIMRQNRNFADAPLLERIHQTDPDHAHQPLTSQAAIEKFERMCRDNDSVLSRAATWGTRRRSFPSALDPDYEETLSGNFLKKLNMGRGDSNRRPSLFSRAFQGLKRQSSSSKRHRPSIPEDDVQLVESPGERRESHDSLAPPARTLSGGLGGAGKKQSVPSINTAFVSMSASVAAVGSTAHVRSGSISAAPSVTSPKSPSALSLGVKNMLRRPRSGSELTSMLKKSGGPPVARLAKTTSAPPNQEPVPATAPALEPDDDEDEDEELYDDAEGKDEAAKYVDDMEPTIAGFKDHVLRLNPMLRKKEHAWLVDRIAFQQLARYKNLLGARIKHLNSVANRQCLCGTLCLAQGGSAAPLDAKGREPLSASGVHDGSDGDLTPLEGAIGKESFPQDIPMPPTRLLPAEFECQLCFQARKFHKPSDWTKHVHEDVQPFTCTWSCCREPKTFKRKADWVRHENEGHRHLEWWTCNVDDCTHTCYRRDNFLQHLVREHKFAEPKVKTKAAIKRAGGLDPTWQKVESCHIETSQSSHDEPCRFCGKTFPSWKKLTVHLAKHMEQISLPVLNLVDRKAVDVDTIISPIQDPPPRTFSAVPAFQHQPADIKMEHIPYNPSSNPAMGRPVQRPLMYSDTQQHGFYAVASAHIPTPSQLAQPPHFQQQGHAFYNNHAQQYNNIGQALDVQINMPVNHGYTTTQGGYADMPVSTGTYIGPGNGTPYISVAPDTEEFPAFVMSNPLGLQDMQDSNGMPYNGMLDQSSPGAGDAYTPHGSHRSSPYILSPGQGQGQFYS
ncbi:Transcription factor IIIA [Coniochaeta hoffmannii]|uniref:Transcription factor IIIA n=1 Tax=Coniochaeta hoffmannii TaxID=91930 RepID=A0AA38VSB0_9PEZI|nr:Transcription factor IIIA [Coniochaeta hoffmannii]